MKYSCGLKEYFKSIISISSSLFPQTLVGVQIAKAYVIKKKKTLTFTKKHVGLLVQAF